MKYILIALFLIGCIPQNKCKKNYDYLVANCPELLKHDSVKVKTAFYIPGQIVKDTAYINSPCNEIVKVSDTGITSLERQLELVKRWKTILKGIQKGIKYETKVDLNSGKLEKQTQSTQPLQLLLIVIVSSMMKMVIDG
jgi:hypothetical protein